jgi:hypothetical protein
MKRPTLLLALTAAPAVESLRVYACLATWSGAAAALCNRLGLLTDNLRLGKRAPRLGIAGRPCIRWGMAAGPPDQRPARLP